MVPKLSAGLLLYRFVDGELQVVIGHPGGPFWARKDDGVWSIPKGEYTEREDPWTVAQREFEEEIGKLFNNGFEYCQQKVLQLYPELDLSRLEEGEDDVPETPALPIDEVVEDPADEDVSGGHDAEATTSEAFVM